MTRILGAWLCLSLLAPAPGQTAVDALRVSLFGIFKPTELSFSTPGVLGLEVRLSSVDGREQVRRGRRLRVRCQAGQPLAIALDGQDLSATHLVLRQRGRESVWAGVPGRQAERPYAGQVGVDEDHGRCRAINLVGLEDYVASVSCGEIRGAGPEALRAQAVVARTWTLRNRDKHRRDGFDFCDLTHCQAYQGSGSCNERQREALPAVRGLVLQSSTGQLLDAAYFSTCGGHTAAAGGVWGGQGSDRALAGVSDGDPAACRRSPHFRWRFTVKRSDLCRKLVGADEGAPGGLCRLEIVSRGMGGWVERLAVHGSRTQTWSGEEFRLRMGRLFGWGALKSAHFELQQSGEALSFIGRGLGHGVGLCQYGAMGLAMEGRSYQEILAHYFPGSRLGNAP